MCIRDRLNYHKCTHNCSGQEASPESEKWAYSYIAFTQTENHIFFVIGWCSLFALMHAYGDPKLGVPGRKGPKLAYSNIILCFLKNCTFSKIIDVFELWAVGALRDPVMGAPGGGQNWPTLIYLYAFCKCWRDQICRHFRDAKWA